MMLTAKVEAQIALHMLRFSGISKTDMTALIEQIIGIVEDDPSPRVQAAIAELRATIEQQPGEST